MKEYTKEDLLKAVELAQYVKQDSVTPLYNGEEIILIIQQSK